MHQYLSIPPDICGDSGLPEFPENQDCTSYDQAFADVCGIVIRPIGVSAPEGWGTIGGWSAVIDNADAGSDTAKYLVGSGSFTPLDSPQISLSGGRLVKNNIHTYQLRLNLFNMDGGHIQFCRKLNVNSKNYAVYIETLERMIGGENGLKPFYVNAEIPFNAGAKEAATILMNFSFAAFPAMS